MNDYTTLHDLTEEDVEVLLYALGLYENEVKDNLLVHDDCIIIRVLEDTKLSIEDLKARVATLKRMFEQE